MAKLGRHELSLPDNPHEHTGPKRQRDPSASESEVASSTWRPREPSRLAPL